jgi:hypothetical protein
MYRKEKNNFWSRHYFFPGVGIIDKCMDFITVKGSDQKA